MRLKSSLDTLVKSVVVLLVVGFTAYGARLALGDNEARTVHDSPITADFSVEDGAELYMTRCMSCHQMNGRGVSGVFPPLVESDWVIGDKGRLIRVVMNGLTGEIDVEGETYSGAMPPWNSFLDDEQMAALLTYIRTSWGNEASEVTAAEVSKVRAATKDRRDPWTQEELAKEENLGVPGMKKSDESGAAKTDSSKSAK